MWVVGRPPRRVEHGDTPTESDDEATAIGRHGEADLVGERVRVVSAVRRTPPVQPASVDVDTPEAPLRDGPPRSLPELVGGVLGAAFGSLHDGTAVPMATGIAVAGLTVLGVYWTLCREPVAS